MKRLLLIDGSNLLFQMFFGMPARIVNREGKAIQGTLGFTGALLKIIRMVNPTHAAVIFDGEHENGSCGFTRITRETGLIFAVLTKAKILFHSCLTCIRRWTFFQ